MPPPFPPSNPASEASSDGNSDDESSDAEDAELAELPDAKLAPTARSCKKSDELASMLIIIHSNCLGNMFVIQCSITIC